MKRAVVLAIGSVGLAIVLRAAAFYRHADGLALALVALIGVGLVSGLAELLVRLSRADGLRAEVAKLPRPCDERALEGASPALASLLRSRAAGVPAAFVVPWTSYLVGLLVMFGLLGTF